MYPTRGNLWHVTDPSSADVPCIQRPRVLRVCPFDPQRPIYSGNATNHTRQSSHHAVRRKITKSAPISCSAPRVTLDKSRLDVLRADYGVSFVLPERCTITRDTRRIHSRSPRHTRPRYLHYYESDCPKKRTASNVSEVRRPTGRPHTTVVDSKVTSGAPTTTVADAEATADPTATTRALRRPHP
jgi:hypothetical protein